MYHASLAADNKGLGADGTAPLGRRLCRQPGSLAHANRERHNMEHVVALADAS